MEPKKTDYSGIIIGMVVIVPVVCVLSAVISFGACKNCNIFIYIANLNAAIEALSEAAFGLANPGIWRELCNEYTLRCILAGLFITGIVVVYIIAGKKNYIRGKEYGTDKYGNVHTINRRLRDPDKANIYQYKYERYTLIERIANNYKCWQIKMDKRRKRRRDGSAAE